jgi:hypothetical protein
LAQLPPQLSDLSLKLSDPLGLRHNQSGQLLIGRRRTSGHHTMINEPAPRSTRHAAQDLTSYAVARSPAPPVASAGRGVFPGVDRRGGRSARWLVLGRPRELISDRRSVGRRVAARWCREGWDAGAVR